MATTLDNGLQRLPECTVCQSKHKCLRGDEGVWCMKVHSATAKQWKTGTMFYHPDPSPTLILPGNNPRPAPTIPATAVPATTVPATAGYVERDMVYRAVLEILTLSNNHRDENIRQGIPDPKGMMYRSLDNAGRKRVEQTIASKTGLTVEQLLTVPGFGRREGKLYLHSYPGLVVPCLSVEGDITALRVRVDDDFIRDQEAKNKPTPRWSYLSNGKDGAKTGPALHYARNAKSVIEAGCAGDRCVTVVLTEGERKADRFAHYAETNQEPVAVVSIPGVHSWQKAGLVDDLLALGVGRVVIAFDSDHQTKGDVAGALVTLVAAIREVNLVPDVATWSPDLGKGIDDLILAGHAFESPDTTFLTGDKLDAYLKDLCDKHKVEQPAELFQQSSDPSPAVNPVDQEVVVDPPKQQMEPFPLDILPPQVADLAEYVGKTVGVDPVVIILPALSCLAGLVGTRRKYQVTPDYVEHCAFWSAIVGDTGSRKTAGLGVAKQPLDEVDDKRNADHEVALEEWKTKCEEWDNASPKQGPRPKEPKSTTFVLDDHTVEVIGKMLNDNRTGVLIVVDELDELFEGFTRYGGNNESRMLKLYNAGTLKVNRIKDGSSYKVKDAIASICSTVQPKTLAKLITADRLESGLAYRFIFANPPRRLLQVKDITDQDRHRAHKAKVAYASLVERLDLLNPLPTVLKPVPEAYALYQEDQDSRERSIHQGDQAEAGRKSKTNALRDRFALLSAICRGAFESQPTEYVEASDVEKGIAFASWVENESRRMAGVLIEAKTKNADDEVMRWLMSCPNQTVAARDLQRWDKKRHFPTIVEVKEALNELVRQGRVEFFKDTDTGGRHGEKYRVKRQPGSR